MKKFILSIVAVLSFAICAGAGNYTINDQAIDALVENSVEISPVFSSLPSALPAATSISAATPSPIGAFLICTFLGGLGIHRHYMGTSSFMWLLYVVTCGGIFGIVPFIDWVFLLVGVVEDDISEYCGNSKFFMWV